jgi:hypothetical protein
MEERKGFVRERERGACYLAICHMGSVLLAVAMATHLAKEKKNFMFLILEKNSNCKTADRKDPETKKRGRDKKNLSKLEIEREIIR